MSRIFWDTNLFIYLFEDAGPLGTRVRELRERMNERGDQLLTSTLTVGEVQVKPLEAGDGDLAEAYLRGISQAADVISFDAAAAAVFARLRATLKLKSPDAIQVSCAAVAGTDLFITNDARLSRVTVPGVEFVASIESSPI